MTRTEPPVLAAAAPVSAAQARVAGVACLALLAPLALQWQVVAVSPVGAVRYAHVGIVVLLLVFGIGVGRFHGLFGREALVLVLLAAMTALAVVSAVAYDAAWADPAQSGLYALVGLAFGAAACTALRVPGGRRVLVWAAPAAVTWTVVEMGRNVAESGVDPVAELGTAFAGADAGSVRRLFRAATAIDGAGPLIDTGRHEVMAALLVTILVTLLAERACRRWVRVVAGVACVVGTAVVVLSLSRSVLLAVVVAVVAVAVRAVRRSPWRRTVPLPALAAVVLLVAAWPLARLLWARTVDDTGSYVARLDAFDVAPAELANRVLAGGPTLATSTHTLPGDVLLQAGWLAGLCALALVAVVARRVLALARRHHDDGSRLHLVALTAASLVLVRSLTTGGGYLDLPAWLAFGLVAGIGVLADRRGLVGTPDR